MHSLVLSIFWGELLISPECFHEINAPINLFLRVRPKKN